MINWLSQDVRANLQNRRLAIASRQRRQIRFRHDLGKLDRCPGEAFEPKAEPDFLRIGRGVVMVQDDVGHRRLSIVSVRCHQPGTLSVSRNLDTGRATGSGGSKRVKGTASGRSTSRYRTPT